MMTEPVGTFGTERSIAVATLRLLGRFDDEDIVGRMSTRRLALGLSEVAISVTWILVDNVTRTTRIAVGLSALAGGVVMLTDALDLRRSRTGDSS